MDRYMDAHYMDEAAPRRLSDLQGSKYGGGLSQLVAVSHLDSSESSCLALDRTSSNKKGAVDSEAFIYSNLFCQNGRPTVSLLCNLLGTAIFWHFGMGLRVSAQAAFRRRAEGPTPWELKGAMPGELCVFRSFHVGLILKSGKPQNSMV